MNFTPESLVNAILGALGGGGMAFWLLRRFVERADRSEARITSLEQKMERLATKDDVATRSDLAQVTARLDRVDATLVQVQLMLERLNTQWKLTHGE